MANRTERKAAARAAREADRRQLTLAAARRRRLRLLGTVLIAAVVALVAAIAVGSSGGGKETGLHLTDGERASTAATVSRELAGIPQAGNVLGDPAAPVTITEYGDVVCPICKEFALTSEPQIIAALVRTGKARLVFRGFETASANANAGQYVDTQVAARSAGLQDKEWNYILTLYQEQPTSIGGTDAEFVPYVTMAYLRRIATQVSGLDIGKWQRHMTDQALISQVSADTRAGDKLNVGTTGTPDVLVSGPTATVNAGGGVPTVAAIMALATRTR